MKSAWNNILFIVSCMFVAGFVFFISIFMFENSNYYQYKLFCDEHQTYCYCSFLEGGCEFKTSISSKYINGEEVKPPTLDNDSLELCELIKKLDDKSMLFKIGCEN